ncbi:MAG: type II toxin-antitoxin system VapB family antitoxin [Acidobacteria bacterium]|nr:type II toxin-antitoxin system VapB family antitoxin [Acidobacteriota bacterium]MCG3191044.1 Antitoxin VapB [Thermoanaerobaculia bacterium]MCK6684892.1 type II toxin-antitoxin system VapB family antitoxin [Thermoanaerobaculia bacterium]
MPLNIKNDAVDRLARELAEITGESITESIRIALEERLRRQRGRIAPLDLKAELASIRKRCSRLPVLDDREPDVILGYDEHGVPR